MPVLNATLARFALALVVAAGSAACGSDRDSPRRRLPDGSRLVQKKEYQALYGPRGRIQRLLHDADHDGVAEAVVVYRADGKPERSELDTNNDHTIDRWETLRPDGTAMTVATSRKGTAIPDTWHHLDAEGYVYQTDLDEDGDGTVDRTDYAPARPTPTPPATEKR